MKLSRIFALTRREQRVVILIVVVLVLTAFVQHWLRVKSQPIHTKSTTAPTLSPSIHPDEEEDSH